MLALPHYKQESNPDKDRCPRARNFYKDSLRRRNLRDNFLRAMFHIVLH